MSSIRKVLFQVHLWTGLIAGLFFIVLGLSGSALVYPSLFQSSSPAPKAMAQGAPLPLEQIIAAARAETPQSETRTATVTLPDSAGNAVMVQFNGQAFGREGRAGRRRGARATGTQGNPGAANRGRADDRTLAIRRGGNPQIFVDPISGQVLGSRMPSFSPVVGVAHRLHETLLMGPIGRTVVAWLGVGMFFLGLSGLYLWWPKKGQWKFAFGVRRNARGFRLHREIHGMMGIWFWAVFLVVTATSLPLGFQTLLGMVTGNATRGEGPRPGAAQVQTVEAVEGTTRMPLARLIAIAEKTAGDKAVSITIPAQPNRPVSVSLESGFGELAPRNIALNPYTGTVLAAPAMVQPGITRRMIEQLHGGAGFGPVWKFLVFLSGFLPLIFVTTGFMMWLKKRQSRAAAKRPAIARAREIRPAVAAAKA